jgi:hypothetical protein
LLVVFSCGVAVGNAIEPEPEVVTKTKTVTQTQTVTETVEVEGDPPAECLEAAQIALDVLQASVSLDKASSEVLNIMSDLRVAIAMSDSSSINLSETDLRKVQQRTLKSAGDLGIAKPLLAEAANACKKEY